MIIRRLRLLNWSLRKLRLPIGLNDLVVEVGSGGNPHPASSVLAEKFVDSSHRLKSIKIDREIVLADACKMPFRDRAFDYSIAFHVLEHVSEPTAFVDEMSRISKAGYIETPNMLYERLFPLNVHLLEVAMVKGELMIFRKPDAVHDRLLEAANLVDNDPRWAALFGSRPELFHVCYKWQGQVRHRVLNPDQSLEWHVFPEAGLIASKAADSNADLAHAADNGVGLRRLIIQSIRWLYVTFGRPKLNVEAILVCPECRGELVRSETRYDCTPCGHAYRATPIRDFTKPIIT